MKIHPFFMGSALIALISLLIICPSANAAHYSFSQNGFPDGGNIKGSFDAIDVTSENGAFPPDGKIVYVTDHGSPVLGAEELSNFFLGFGGNSEFGNLNTLSTIGLQSLTLDYADNSLSLSFGTFLQIFQPDAFNSSTIDYSGSTTESGSITLQDNNGLKVWDSDQPIILTKETPLPGALGLFVLGLAWLGFFRENAGIKTSRNLD